MNHNTERLIKSLHTDLENGKMSNNRSRLSFSQMTGLIDNLYVFKLLMDQNIAVFKRMSECDTLTAN